MKEDRKADLLEEALSSKGRVRVLRVLMEAGELNASEIARRANLNYSTALSHLLALKRVGLVEERKYGRIRIFKIADNGRVEYLRELFKALLNALKAGT